MKPVKAEQIRRLDYMENDFMQFKVCEFRKYFKNKYVCSGSPLIAHSSLQHSLCPRYDFFLYSRHTFLSHNLSVAVPFCVSVAVFSSDSNERSRLSNTLLTLVKFCLHSYIVSTQLGYSFAFVLNVARFEYEFWFFSRFARVNRTCPPNSNEYFP